MSWQRLSSSEEPLQKESFDATRMSAATCSNRFRMATARRARNPSPSSGKGHTSLVALILNGIGRFSLSFTDSRAGIRHDARVACMSSVSKGKGCVLPAIDDTSDLG